jgi:ABC-type multidrug transport system permease subunit
MVTKKVAGTGLQSRPARTAKRNVSASSVITDALAAALFVGLIVALIVIVCGALMIASPR